MAAIALPRPIAPHRSSSTIASIATPISLETISTPPSVPVTAPLPVPNKHIPVCPPGPPVAAEDLKPPSPLSDTQTWQSSLLSPPDKYVRLDSGPLSLYKIDARDVAAALNHTSRQPLPEPPQVFPWLHGLHPQNHIQQAFFIARRRELRKTPCCLRGITIVKADGDLTASRLKGAVVRHEILQPGPTADFLDIDPKEGFSVRNFHIQAAKSATTSDIIVYGDDEVAVTRLGWDIAEAQLRWRESHQAQGQTVPHYNTFICLNAFGDFEERHGDIVAVDSAGLVTGYIVDFFHQERKEMYAMTRATEISKNVWLGPTPDPGGEGEQYDVLIECSDLGHLNPAALRAIAEGGEESVRRHYLEFPSSGTILPPSWSQAEADAILETCKWIYHLAHGSYPPLEKSSFEDDDDDEGGGSGGDADGDAEMSTDTQEPPPPKVRPRKILIHCADGYTESTMLGIAYYSYSSGRPVPDAWLNLHTTMKRNFFAYPADVALLTNIAPRLLRESPVCAALSLSDVTALVRDEPRWLPTLDGSFPSRILDYMYLGNLGHANNPDLLRALGIGQLLSVGETAMWRDGEYEAWGADNVCLVQGVQDNGIDPLTDEFERCLEFIDRGRRNGTATLVHCRVGVSRSATICIAEVMRALDMSFPRAYCFVRARRLNVIIQPHLKFAYELLKWEEYLQEKKGCSGFKRELEWGEIAREIALMNRPYASR